MNPIQKEIFKSIDIITDKKINDLQLDKTIIATIFAHPTASENLYRILYQGLKYDAYSSTNESYAVNDSVLVLVPDNQFSNKKIILMKEPKVAEALTTASGGGTGTATVGVTQVSVVTANGFAGTVANSSSTASITLTTTINGVLRGNGTAISAATVTGTGSVVLSGNPTMSTASFTGQIFSTVATGVSPLSVVSTTKVTNLNADLLDDQSGAYYLDYNNFTNTPSIITYPGAGIPNSTGTAWATSYSVTGTGTQVVLSSGPTISTASFTGQTFFADGTRSAPSITHAGDSNTGIYFPTNDKVAIATSGAERLFVDNAGNVGIGLSQLTQASGLAYINNQFLVNALSNTTLGYDISTNTVGGFIRNGNANISVISGTPNVARLYFGDTSSETLSSISHNGSNHATRPTDMFFTVNGLEVMRLTSASIVAIGTTTGSEKLTVLGNISASGQLISTVATGTAPLTVASTTKVTNLNADYLDGSSSEYYLNYNNLSNTPTIGNGTLTLATSGLGLSGSTTFTANTTSNSTFTITSNATSSNVASTIMARTAQGTFSATDMTLSGQGLFAPGGVGTPSISFTNDPNTGIYNVAADNIAIVNGGAEKARFNSNGQLLVGLTATGTAGNSLLYVSQGATVFNDGATLPYFQTYNSNAGTDLKTWRHGGDSSGNYQFQTVNDAYSSANNRLTFYNTGEVGIGTTAPLSKLHVNANTGVPTYTVATGGNLIVTGTDTTANVLELDSFAGTNQIIARRANTTLASPTTVGGNTNMLQIISRAYNGTAYPTTDSARISFVTNGAQNTTTSGASLVFSNTATLTNSIAEAMRIHGAQEVLIGYTSTNTTSTSYKLQVNSQIFATSGTIATSDGNYKTNIEPLTDSLNIINSLNPVSFNWKPHPTHNFDLNTTTVGFIAQEVQEVLKDKPYVNSIIKQNQTTYYDESGEQINEPFLGIAEGNLIAILTRAIQEQQEQINNLKLEVQQLKTMVQ